MPGSLTDIAVEIINSTRVLTDAANASPGKPVQVSVIPGFTPQVPTSLALSGVNLTGTIGGTIGGPLSGTLSGLLNAIVNPVKIIVKYTVKRGGAPVAASEFSATPPLAAAPTDSDPLNVAFLLRPPVGENTVATDPFDYEIEVNLSVNVDGNEIHTGPPPNDAPVGLIPPITIPVAMPALQIPALLLLGKHANFAIYDGDEPGSLFVMVRASSPLRELGDVVATVNRLMSLVKSLKDVLDFGSDFIDALGDAATLIGAIPTMYFSVGNAPDLDGDGLSFEDDASSLLLIGVHDGTNGTQVTLYSDEGFDKGGIDEEHTTFTVDEIVVGGVHTGVGVKRINDFTNPQLDWSTDPGDHMNDDTASVRWGPVP